MNKQIKNKTIKKHIWLMMRTGMEASTGALIKCCSQNQRQIGVSLNDISWERKASCSHYAVSPASPHRCTAPPRTPAEIFLFLHKNTSTRFPSPRTVLTSFSRPKKAKILGSDGRRREWHPRDYPKMMLPHSSRMNQLNTTFI